MRGAPRPRRVPFLLVAILVLWGCENPFETGGRDRPDGAASVPRDELFDVPPDTSTCEPGVLSAEFKARVLAYLNEVRELHGLPRLRYDWEDDELVQAAALIFVANARLSHNPHESFHCYSDEGRLGAETSNTLLTAGNEVGDMGDPARYIDEWMIDRSVANLGHRRFLLDPFMEKVSFGMVTGEPLVELPYRPVVGAALKVVAEEQPSLLLTDLEIIAYPYGEYPANLFALDAALSFSVFASRFGYAPNREVSYEAASITVRAGGTELPVHSIESSNTVEGLPNIVQWRVDGLERGVRHDVSIDDVMVFGEPRSYEYTFTVVDP